MKMKNLFSILGLSVATTSAAFVINGMNSQPAKAATDDTWMIHAVFEIGEIANWTNDGVDFNSFVFHPEAASSASF